MAAAKQGISKSGAIFFSSLCATTFGLGSWQTQRYFEKVEMMKEREKQLSQSPLPLMKNVSCSLQEMVSFHNHHTDSDIRNPESPSEISDLKSAKTFHSSSLGYQPWTVEGIFRHEDSVFIGPRGPPVGVISSSGPNSGRSSGGMASSPQGYYIITPFERTDNMGTVLINRGWVPLHLVKKVQSRSPHSHALHDMDPPSLWMEQPKGKVILTCIASSTEQPTFISPVHDRKNPRHLLWFDREAIENKTHTMGLSPLLLTEIVESGESSSSSSSTTTSTTHARVETAPSVPIKPSKHSVGEFKVTPATHAGYAMTWFGLSGAGMVMTRKLMTRGR